MLGQEPDSGPWPLGDRLLEEQLALDQIRRVSGLLSGRASRGADPPYFIITNGIHLTSVETTS